MAAMCPDVVLGCYIGMLSQILTVIDFMIYLQILYLPNSAHSSLRLGAHAMTLQSNHKSLIEIAILILVYGFCIALASALWKHPVILTGSYVLISIVVLIKWHTKADVISFTTAALLGPLGESIAIHYGAWTYSKSILNIPMWLPLLWGIAGAFLRRLAWEITNYK